MALKWCSMVKSNLWGDIQRLYQRIQQQNFYSGAGVLTHDDFNRAVYSTYRQ